MDKTIEALLQKLLQEGGDEEIIEIVRQHILKLDKLADVDELTQLYNRRVLLLQLKMRIRYAKREKNKFAVVMLDIDFFKKINDTYGHAIGDQVLKDISAHFLSSTRENDLVTRFGGEEFIIVAHYKDRAGFEKYLEEKIRQGVESHVKIGNESVTVSIGATYYKPNLKISLEEMSAKLLKEADLALYKAKHNGRNRIEIYTSELE